MAGTSPAMTVERHAHLKGLITMPALTPEAWAQIRYDYEHTDRPVADICAEHGISSGTLRDRMRRWHWRRRREPIPREGPPAFLVVEQASAPTGTAMIVAKPSTPAPAEDGSGAAPPVAALRPAAGDAGPLAPALQKAVTTVLPAIQQTLARIAEGRAYPDDAAKTARALETLTRTLRELSGLPGGRQRRR
jgi:transposase-like protein